MRKSVAAVKSETPPNPFWDEAARLFIYPPMDELEYYRTIESERRFQQQLESVMERDTYCRRYAWAVPDPDSLDFVAEQLGDRAIEIGAGTGYWAWQLSLRGVDILAYDNAPPDRILNGYFQPRDGQTGEYLEQLATTYYEVREGGPEVLVQYRDRSLFLCWPPYARSFADQCLQHYQGNRLVYIGEGQGGCTGDDDFFRHLGAVWSEVAEHRIVQWYGIHDRIIVYERK